MDISSYNNIPLILSNNCAAATVYNRFYKTEYLHPFIYCMIPPKDYIYLLEHFDEIDFRNTTFKLVSSYENSDELISESMVKRSKTNRLKDYDILNNIYYADIDGKVRCTFGHHVRVSQFDTIVKNETDILYNDIKSYLEERWKKRTERLYKWLNENKNTDNIIFIINDGLGLSNDDFEKICEANTKYKKFIITNNIQHKRYQSEKTTVIINKIINYATIALDNARIFYKMMNKQYDYIHSDVCNNKLLISSDNTNVIIYSKQYKNNTPFMYTYIPPDDYIYMIEHFDDIDFTNFKIKKITTEKERRILITHKLQNEFNLNGYPDIWKNMYYVEIDNHIWCLYENIIENTNNEELSCFYFNEIVTDGWATVAKYYITGLYNMRKMISEGIKPIFIYNHMYYNIPEHDLAICNAKTKYKNIVYTCIIDMTLYNSDTTSVMLYNHLIQSDIPLSCAENVIKLIESSQI